MAKQTQDTVMTIADLAKYLKLSTSTLYKLCAEGKVPGQKVDVRDFSKEDTERILDAFSKLVDRPIESVERETTKPARNPSEGLR